MVMFFSETWLCFFQIGYVFSKHGYIFSETWLCFFVMFFLNQVCFFVIWLCFFQNLVMFFPELGYIFSETLLCFFWIRYVFSGTWLYFFRNIVMFFMNRICFFFRHVYFFQKHGVDMFSNLCFFCLKCKYVMFFLMFSLCIFTPVRGLWLVISEIYWLDNNFEIVMQNEPEHDWLDNDLISWFDWYFPFLFFFFFFFLENTSYVAKYTL